MTKPLGSGIISSAIKKNIASEKAVSEVTEVMTTLNDKALEAARELNANAITDVTGFGLLGHLIEMIGDSDVTVDIYLDNVPVIKHAKEYFNNGVYPSGSKRNFDLATKRMLNAGALVSPDRYYPSREITDVLNFYRRNRLNLSLEFFTPDDI